MKIQLSRPFVEATRNLEKENFKKTEARDHYQTHFWVLHSHFSLGKLDFEIEIEIELELDS